LQVEKTVKPTPPAVSVELTIDPKPKEPFIEPKPEDTPTETESDAVPQQGGLQNQEKFGD
jgi:hypothetical protein